MGRSTGSEEYAGPMTRVCRRASIAALLLILAAVPSAASSTPISRVFGVADVGGLATGSSYVRAIRHFGARADRAFVLGGCRLRYRTLGLTLWYSSDPLKTGSPSRCTLFSEAIATGVGWHTRNGLFVGDSTAKLRRLFPHAYNTHRAGPLTTPPGSIQWDITITSGGGARPALSVTVARGRIISLLIQVVGH